MVHDFVWGDETVGSFSNRSDEIADRKRRAPARSRVAGAGASGAKAQRDGLAEALEAVEAGDQLVTWRFDRIARSLQHLMDIAASLNVKGAGLISLTENVDTSSLSGMLVLQIFEAVAGFERNLLIERTKAGLAAARKRSARTLRPLALSDDDFAYALSSLREGQPVTRVAASLKISRSTLYRYMRVGGRT